MEDFWIYVISIITVSVVAPILYRVIHRATSNSVYRRRSDNENISSDTADYPFGQCCQPSPITGEQYDKDKPTHPWGGGLKENLIQLQVANMFCEDNGLVLHGVSSGRFTSNSDAVHQDCRDSEPGRPCPNNKGCEVESYNCQRCESYKTFRKREEKFEGMSFDDRYVLQSDFCKDGGEIDIKLMQKQSDIWRKYNFPNSQEWHPMAGINEEIGEAVAAILTVVESDEFKAYAKHSDVFADICEPLLKIVEASGRINHGVLKKSQKIRVNEDHDAAIKDATGDIFIYLLDFCNRYGIDMSESIKDAWDEVRKRDWKMNKDNGKI